MGDDERYPIGDAGDQNDSTSGEELPASVIFMEMMRQAAARRASNEARAKPVPHRGVPEAPLDPASASAIPLQRATVRRVRRKPKRALVAVNVIGGLLRAFIIVIVASGLMATIFTWWTPNEFISDSARQSLSIAVATDAVTLVPTVLPTP
ncbi:MAG: hypothetical protein H7Y11_15005, partial [Armatimonadetes bacterium]|nr:hypothetical protein [Anaerolineae bacterium]